MEWSTAWSSRAGQHGGGSPVPRTANGGCSAMGEPGKDDRRNGHEVDFRISLPLHRTGLVANMISCREWRCLWPFYTTSERAHTSVLKHESGWSMLSDHRHFSGDVRHISFLVLKNLQHGWKYMVILTRSRLSSRG